MSERAILHSDLNCFFASVETVLNPDYRGKAIAVCGSTEDRHGIVVAKSESARRAGVATGMVNWQARRLCPELIIVEPHYEYYAKFSELVRRIYYRYTDLVEPFGLDECWLDVTGSSVFGSPSEIAESIRRSVRDELGLTVSIGVSFNKVFAKLGSDMKKPDAVTVIDRDNFRKKVWPLDVSDLLYVGRSSCRKLHEYGIFTIGELALTPVDTLERILGVNGKLLSSYARGEDESRVMHKDYVSPMKSLGHGITCTADLVNEDEVWRVLLALSQDLGHRLRVHGLAASGVQLSVKDNDLKMYQFRCRLPVISQSPYEIALCARRLFTRYDWKKNVRALTVQTIDLVPQEQSFQTDLFTDYSRSEKQQSIDDAVDNIRNRFGKRAVSPASLMGDLKMPDNSDRQNILPGMMYK